MIVSIDHNFLFVHIPKTAGVSITKALSKSIKVDNELTLRKTKHESYREFVNRTGIDNLNVWTFVRNPIDRFLSFHRYLNRHARYNQVLTNDPNDFIELIKQNNTPLIDNLYGLKSQSFFIEGAKNISIQKYEKLDHGVQELSKFLNTNITLGHENSTAKTDSYLTKNSIAYIKDKYKEDFKNFNYS